MANITIHNLELSNSSLIEDINEQEMKQVQAGLGPIVAWVVKKVVVTAAAKGVVYVIDKVSGRDNNAH